MNALMQLIIIKNETYGDIQIIFKGIIMPQTGTRFTVETDGFDAQIRGEYHCHKMNCYLCPEPERGGKRQFHGRQNPDGKCRKGGGLQQCRGVS